jgi:5-methylcytosine-specific restriction endonuclease McrA
MTKSENIKNYYKKKAFEKHEQKRKESSCTYGYYENVWDRAFHNCFMRAKNFKGYINEFKAKIESTFKDGMLWENYGEWEIDHIIPLSKGGEHNVNNIQALWKNENRCKYNKIQ